MSWYLPVGFQGCHKVGRQLIFKSWTNRSAEYPVKIMAHIAFFASIRLHLATLGVFIKEDPLPT